MKNIMVLIVAMAASASSVPSFGDGFQYVLQNGNDHFMHCYQYPANVNPYMNDVYPIAVVAASYCTNDFQYVVQNAKDGWARCYQYSARVNPYMSDVYP